MTRGEHASQAGGVSESSSDKPVQSSPLESLHVRLGARMVPFAGWNMPVQYSSIMDEHAAVRGSVGIFDISHMGQFIVSGPGALAWLNRMFANNVAKLAPGQQDQALPQNRPRRRSHQPLQSRQPW